MMGNKPLSERINNKARKFDAIYDCLVFLRTQEHSLRELAKKVCLRRRLGYKEPTRDDPVFRAVLGVVTKTCRKLKNWGYLKSRRRRVKGEVRKVLVYSITAKGRRYFIRLDRRTDDAERLARYRGEQRSSTT